MSLLSFKALQQISRYSSQSVLKNNLWDSKLCLNKTYAVPLITQHRKLFWERSRKGRYESNEKISPLTHIRNGVKELKGEMKLWLKEMKEHFESDPQLICRPGETDVLWCFDKPEVIDKFVATSDSDHNEGYSKCNFEMSSAGRGLFHGHLNVRVPKDGKIKKSGYCAIRSKRVRKSFKRDFRYDWNLYNTIVLKVRGDGRSYLLNLSCEGFHDITWNDIYHYVLYTRGGPYWQVARIPFSKFILGAKGRLQDKQVRVRLDRVTHFGITCADKIEGPFQLEIEYVGLEFDPIHEEDFAYEMYKTDKYIVGVYSCLLFILCSEHRKAQLVVQSTSIKNRCPFKVKLLALFEMHTHSSTVTTDYNQGNISTELR